MILGSSRSSFIGDGVALKDSFTQQPGVPGAMAVAVEPALLLAPGAMATPRWETGVTGVHMEESGVSLSFAGGDTDEFGPSSRHLSERNNGKNSSQCLEA